MRDVNAGPLNAGRDINVYDHSDQAGNGSNLLKLRDIGSHANVTVTQNITPKSEPNHVQLEIDPDSIQRYPKAEVERRSVRGGIFAAIWFLMSISPYFADYLEIFSHFGISGGITTIASLAIALGGVLLLRRQKDIEFLRLRLRRPKNPNELRRIDLQRFYEVDDEGNYLIYKCSAHCIYPKCYGKITVEHLPPREECRKGFAGVCSVAGNGHSYLIDRSWVATPKDLDWRPLDPPSSSPGYGR